MKHETGEGGALQTHLYFLVITMNRSRLSLGNKSINGNTTNTRPLPWPVLGTHREWVVSYSELNREAEGRPELHAAQMAPAGNRDKQALGSMTDVARPGVCRPQDQCDLVSLERAGAGVDGLCSFLCSVWGRGSPK